MGYVITTLPHKVLEQNGEGERMEGLYNVNIYPKKKDLKLIFSLSYRV